MNSDDKISSFFIKKRYYLPFLSALLLSISIIPFHLLITNFFFLVPLLFYIDGLKGWKETIRGSLWFALPLYLLICYWMYALLRISVLALVLYIALVLYLSIPASIFVLLSYFIYNRWKIRFFLFIPSLWIVIENLKTFGPFRETADHLSHSMALFPSLIQFADMTGSYGIAFWLILVNSLLFETLMAIRRKEGWMKYLVSTWLLILLPISYSLYQWKTIVYKPDLKISMIQPNISLEKKLRRGFESENMERLLSMTSEAIHQEPALIIWPETSYPIPIEHWTDRDEEPSLPGISAMAYDSEIPILVGAEYIRIGSRKDFKIYNAAFLVDSHGRIQDYYGKIYLVPFTEAIPFRDILGMERMGKKGFLARLGGFSSGEKWTLFHIEKRDRKIMEEKGRSGDGKKERKDYAHGWRGKMSGERVSFGVLICYEGLYPELSRQFKKKGADFLVCITNDAWFGKTLFPFWHASALRLRAIENRVSIARCANTGISCFIDPAGRMFQETDLFQKTIVTGSIAIPHSSTIYAKYGDIIVDISYPIILILIFLALFFRGKPQ